MARDELIARAQRELAAGKAVEVSAGCFGDWTRIAQIAVVGQLVHVVVDAPAKPDVYLVPDALGAVRIH